MEDKKAPEFKIRIDKERPEHDFQEVKKDLRFEKLNQRVTIISILIPCIIVILLVVSYLDMKNKITGVHYSGSIEVKNLSQNIDKKTAELSSQYAKLEASLDKKTAALKTEFQNLAKDMKETKAEKTEVANSIEEINRQISAARNDISAISTKVKAMEVGLSQKITEITKSIGRIESDLAKLRSDITGISASKADKKDIEAYMRNEQKRYQNELNRLSGDVEDKIDSIRRQIDEIEKKTVKMAPPATQQLKTDNTRQPPVSKGESSQPGKIVEQDLK